ncbi:hypothetical protein MMC30_003089 [Trapelia coarctata]|nr:hypothetical protein [Trapelia coarctata]
MFRWDAGQYDALAYVTSRCKRLEYLDLRDGFGNVALASAVTTVPVLKTLIISPDRGVTMREVTELLAKLPHLEHAEFHKIWTSAAPPEWNGDLSSLRVLKLHAAQEDRVTVPLRLSLDGLFPLTPRLQELSLQTTKSSGPRIVSDFSTLTKLRSLSLDQVDIAAFPCLPDTLQSLTMNDTWGIGNASDLANHYMERNTFAALTALTVSPARHLRPEVLHALIENGAEKLRKCHLSDFDCRVEVPPLITSGYLSEVVDLRLSNADLTDSIAQAIAKHCPRLQKFEASHNSKLTGVGVKALMLKEGDKLVKLKIDHCVGVGVDAVEFARSMGAEVKFSLAETLFKKGKRLGNMASRCFSKRDDLSSPAEAPTLVPRGTVNWCRKGSNEWLTFPTPGGTPGGNFGMQTKYGNLFKMGLQTCQDQINAGNGNGYVGSVRALGCVNGYNDCLIARASTTKWTWAQTMVAVQILQNYVYVTRHYAQFDVSVMIGGTKMGTLTLN